MVIQRWQTVYLLMAVLVLGIASFVPAFSVVSPHYSYDASLSTIFSGQPIPSSMVGYFILVALSAVMSLITIFKFKVLKLQKTLCSVVMLLTLVATLLLGLGIFTLPEGEKFSLSLAACAAPFAFIFVLLARGRIEKDEKLLKSADRIR